MLECVADMANSDEQLIPDKFCELSDPTVVDRLVNDLVSGTRTLEDPSTTNDLVCTADAARRIIEAASQPANNIWAGHIVESLTLDVGILGPFTMSGSINGDFVIPKPVSGTLTIRGAIEGLVSLDSVETDVYLNESASIGTGLFVTGAIGGDLVSHGVISGDMALEDSVGGSVTLSGSIHGNVGVGEEVSGNIYVDGSLIGDLNIADVAKRIVVRGAIEQSLVLYPYASAMSILVTGDVKGDIDIMGGIGSLILSDTGKVDGQVNVSGNVTRTVEIAGSVRGEIVQQEGSRIEGDIEISGSVGGALGVFGTVTGEFGVYGQFGDDISLLPDRTSELRVAVLAPRTTSNIFIGPNVDMQHANFRGFAAYDKLNFLGDRPFATVEGGRQALLFASADGQKHGTPYSEQAAIYRQLRTAFEKKSNRPAASDLYYGETEARRNAIVDRYQKGRPAEWWILTVYKRVSAYGTRSLRTLVLFAVVAVLASLAFAINGVDLTETYEVKRNSFFGGGWNWGDASTMFLFTVRSMVSFFSPPQGNLTTAEGYLQLSLRFVGPVLLTQAAFAIRDRVAR